MRGWAVAIGWAAMACAGPPPPPPTAVVDVAPDAVCEGDGFLTPIVISGRRSAARLSLVPAPPEPGASPLVFAWDLSGAEHVVIDGALDEPELTVLTAGDRPLHAALTVTEPDEGGQATTVATLGVIVPFEPPCEDGCPEGTTCDGERCRIDVACAADEDCPACFACAEGRCAR